MSNVNLKDFNRKPAIFQASARNAQTYEECKENNIDVANEDAIFEAYAIRVGEELQFPEDLNVTDAVRIHPTATAKNAWMWIVPCRSTYKGVTKDTWFNVSSFKRMDINQNPMHPEWYALGSLGARVEALAKTGMITGEKTESFQVPKEFAVGADGRLRPTTDADGKVIPSTKEEVIVSAPAK